MKKIQQFVLFLTLLYTNFVESQQKFYKNRSKGEVFFYWNCALCPKENGVEIPFPWRI